MPEATHIDRQSESADPRLGARFLLATFAYFFAQFLLRLTHSGALGLDEAEQFAAAQSLHWGYGPQPPLYSWIAYGLFNLFGPSVFALALLKNSLLCATYVLIFASGKHMFGDARRAALAAGSLVFLPQILWESQRELTHSVLAVTLCAACFRIFLATLSRPTTPLRIALGFSAGLAVLAKYNSVCFLIGLVAACLGAPSIRRTFRSPKAWIPVLVASATVAPHLIWASQHQDWVLASVDKFEFDPETSPWRARLTGAVRFLEASFQFLGLWMGIQLALRAVSRTSPHKPKPSPSVDPIDSSALRWTILGAVFAVVLALLVSGATNVKDRWLQPALFLVPLWGIATYGHRIPARGSRFLFTTVGIAALSALVATKLNYRWGGWGKPSRFAAPFEALSSELPIPAEQPILILADSPWPAGNLQRLRPQATVAYPETPLKDSATRSQRALILWRARKERLPPESLQRLAQVHGFDIPSETAPTFIHIPYSFVDEALSYGVLIVDRTKSPAPLAPTENAH